jgi:hypothetical protein
LDSPFLDARCLVALNDACRTHKSETERSEQMPDIFGATQGFKVSCVWSKAVTFADVTTCAVQSVEWRCEATLKQDFLVCNDPCRGGKPNIYNAWTAFPNASQLEFVLCDGPLGPDASVYRDAAAPRQQYLCVDPPPSPVADLCQCAATACRAGEADGGGDADLTESGTQNF